MNCVNTFFNRTPSVAASDFSHFFFNFVNFVLNPLMCGGNKEVTHT